MASFTSVGDNVELSVADRGETVAVAISGTYNMTIALQREQGSPGSGAWQTIKEYSTANATVAENYVTQSYNEKVRLIVLVDTSGTATATLTDNSDLTLLQPKDALGNVMFTVTQAGVSFPGTVDVTGATTLTSVVGGDNSLGITGQTQATTVAGGAVAIAGAASIAGATGAGGPVTVTGGASGSTNDAGGAVTVTGGAGSGTGAGGAVSAVGGAAGATGTGGAASVTSGAGGATSGASGAVTVASGTTTADSGSATGAVTVQSGAGAASAVATAGGASGAVTLRSQAGGANTGGASGEAGGAAGAVAITGGAGGATDSTGAHAGGAGGAVTVTGGAGGNASAGTGNGGAGGDINLVPGAGGTSSGGSAGTKGLVKVNGDANLMTATYMFTGTPAATNQAFFIAPRAMKIVSIRQVHSAAAGGTSTLDVTKDTGTDAPAAGTAVTSAAFNLESAANTVQTGTLAADATITLAAGDRLSVKYNHAIQSSAGVVVTAGMVPI